MKRFSEYKKNKFDYLDEDLAGVVFYRWQDFQKAVKKGEIRIDPSMREKIKSANQPIEDTE